MKSLDRIEPEGIEEAMEIVTSCMASRIEQGLKRGREEGRGKAWEEGFVQGWHETLARMIPRILKWMFGELPEVVEEQVRGLDGDGLAALDEVFLDFEGLEDLVGWLLGDDGRAVALLEGVCGEVLDEGLRERVVGLGLEAREALVEVVWEFEGVGDLEAWLAENVSSRS